MNKIKKTKSSATPLKNNSVNSVKKNAQLVPLLLAWFATNARDLPWRRTRDPYAVWVSEIILQHMDDRLKPTWRWTTTRLMAEDSAQYVAPAF